MSEETVFRIKLITPKGKKVWVKGATFKKRQQARQWCRNHWYKRNHEGMLIIHPDRTEETFEWSGRL